MRNSPLIVIFSFFFVVIQASVVPTAFAFQEQDSEQAADPLEAEFIAKLESAATIAEVEQLLNEYAEHEFAVKGVAKIEDLIIEDLKSNGSGDRYKISDICAIEGRSSRGITLSSAGEDMLSASCEVPSDALEIYNGRMGFPHGVYAVHRYDGEVELFDHTFIGEGDKLHRLTFVLCADGYVHVRGQGEVIASDGSVTELGK